MKQRPWDLSPIFGVGRKGQAVEHDGVGPYHGSSGLPAKYPELNPQENVWQFLRDN